jgi:hypothetical protein
MICQRKRRTELFQKFLATHTLHTLLSSFCFFFPFSSFVLYHLFSRPMATSLSTDPPEDHGMDWADDNNNYVSGSLLSLGKRAPPSAITSASSRYPETPSSQLSQPSGLPVEIIAGLTHDELRRNAEFMKYVALVGSLQELLSLQEKKPPSPSPFPHNCESSAPALFIFHLRSFFSAPPTVSPSSSLHPRQSASQVSPAKRLSVPLPHPQSVIRPAEYPPSVLWTFQDYKDDPNVGVSAGNIS